MKLRPQSAAGWTVYTLGAFALVMGLVGLISPSTQLSLMGFEPVGTRQPGDYTIAVLAITSLAAVNTATFYLVAAVRGWPGFLSWAVMARLVMGMGLAALAWTGVGPSAFVSAAIWEAIGAALIAGVAVWERGKSARSAP
jgi:hypothetical protein